MDKLTEYRNIVQALVRGYGCGPKSDGSVEYESIIDPVGDHYEIMSVGWQGQERVHSCLLHIDLKNDKIWIQYDGIEGGVADRLVAAGVPKQDIVLAFHSPFKRKFTEFAAG
jgi:hypothetical protein